MNSLVNKSELLFCYDVKDANPNGDPMDENKPRIDEETGHNIVTDVRLKRTVRDYLFAYKGYDGNNGLDIFVREIADEEGKIQDGKTRAMNFNGNREDILDRCIDIRLFGGTIPLPKDSITLTGPVQFKMGRSLHPVVMKHVKGTGAFASREGTKHSTFREEDILYYSFVTFHGIVNPAAAADSKATREDVALLMEGLWEGTKNLISRSKFGQMPRFLLKINYNSPWFFIGDLDRMAAVDTELPYERLRDVSEMRLDVSALKSSLQQHATRISSVEYRLDPRLKLQIGENAATIQDLLGKIPADELTFS
jgi:CRISPR-associated protein Csh2